MERANDVTRSFLDLRLLPALPVAWLPPWQRHSPQVSWKPIQMYRSKPRGRFMATCRAQTSLQPPLALPDTSSHCLQVYNSRDESYIKAPTATSKREEATSRGAWEFLSVNCPHADITSSNVPYFSSFMLF